MKHWWLAGLIGVSLSAAAMDDPDMRFYEKATQSGLAEIEGGLLAQQRGKSPDVVSFGAMMAKDHNAANLKLRELAGVNHVELPVAVSADQAAKKAELSVLSGDDFDRAYIEWQILSHRDAIALFKIEGESGDDKDARQFAIDTLPTLQVHLAKLLAMPMIAPAAPNPAATAPNPASAPPLSAAPATPPPTPATL